MATPETIITGLLNQSGIEINGNAPWDLHVSNPLFYERALSEGSLGLGESYMDGWWDCAALDELVNRMLRARLDQKIKNNFRLALDMLSASLFNRQSARRALEVGKRHYDLGNDLYRAMLDKRMTYSCGYWKQAVTLDEAQEAKLDLVCKKIGARPGMRILDIGCGWGSFAKFAAEKYGASVVGITISKEQLALGTELCRGLPVELRFQDYRQVTGTFDAVISIGSFEHVGAKNYGAYMQMVDRCLKPDGVSLIHTIGANFSLKTGEAWTDKYIFPNGVLPSIAQLGKAMEDQFVMEDWHNIGPDYDRTLMAWDANFEKAWPDLQKDYDQRFYRMWRYFLLSSAGGFRARTQQLWQIVFTRQGTPQPNCRFS